MTAPSWMSGYVGDVSYTLGFYREMAPSFLNYVCVINGYAGTARLGGLRYCELGCGLGYGTALLAAANPDGSFVGIDFNPAHIREARNFSEAAGIGNVSFIEADFADAAQATDPHLEQFDIVALHGVFSWVSPEIRESILAFLRNRLAPGGIAYVSYNSYPGWSAAAPIQRILKESATRARGGVLERVAAGRGVLKTLLEKSSGFSEQSPAMKRRIAMLAEQSPQYLAHEYLNDTWEPFYVTDAMAAFAEAKLTFAGSATIADNRADLCVPKDLIPLVLSAPDLAFRELLKDYAINKQFRRDVYIKGPTRISGTETTKRYDEMAVALTVPLQRLPDSWQIPAGTVRFVTETVEAILSTVAEGPTSCGALRALGREKNVSDNELMAILDVLIHNNVINPCRSDFTSIDPVPAQRLNKAILGLAHDGDTHRYLASPITGSAIDAPFFERLAGPVLAANSEASDSVIAALLFDLFESTEKGITRDGQPLKRNEQTLADVSGLVHSFRQSGLPRWQALGVLA